MEPPSSANGPRQNVAERDDEDDAALGPGFDSARRLCPDGSCVGVIGEDDRCRECGSSFGEARGLGPEAFAGGCSTDDDVAETLAFDASRKLCPDGACVGVIGAEGRCPVCGRLSGPEGV